MKETIKRLEKELAKAKKTAATWQSKYQKLQNETRGPTDLTPDFAECQIDHEMPVTDEECESAPW